MSHTHMAVLAVLSSPNSLLYLVASENSPSLLLYGSNLPVIEPEVSVLFNSCLKLLDLSQIQMINRLLGRGCGGWQLAL